MKKAFLLFFTLFVLAAIANTALTAAQGLELTYPSLPGAQLSQKPILPDFVKYIYIFSVLAAGFLAVGSSVYGGFKYIASAGSPSARNEARAQITGGIFGSLVILGAYILLSTINPQLTIFKIEKPLAQIQVAAKCNCFISPTTDECKKTCKKREVASRFLEIPVGTLVEKVLDKNRLDKFENIANQLEEKYAKNVRDKARAFKEELDQCRCDRGGITFGCTVDCKPLQCTGEPCDRTAIERKKTELNASLDELAKYVEANIGVNITVEEQ